MALMMNVNCRGIDIENAYIKISSFNIDNDSKKASGCLTLHSKKGEGPLPLDLESQFFGVLVEQNKDPRESIYNHLMSLDDYKDAVKVDD